MEDFPSGIYRYEKKRVGNLHNSDPKKNNWRMKKAAPRMQKTVKGRYITTVYYGYPLMKFNFYAYANRSGGRANKQTSHVYPKYVKI